jgi:LEA14-like dessication related protein
MKTLARLNFVLKRTSLTFLILLLGAGCSSLLEKSVEKPKIELDHVGVKDTDFRGTTAVFFVRVQNPNRFALKIDDVAYRVFLAGEEFAKSNVGQATTVPAQGESLIEIPLPVSYDKLAGGLQALLMSKPVDYRIEGDAKLSLFSIPFKKEGKLELR